MLRSCGATDRGWWIVLKKSLVTIVGVLARKNNAQIVFLAHNLACCAAMRERLLQRSLRGRLFQHYRWKAACPLRSGIVKMRTFALRDSLAESGPAAMEREVAASGSCCRSPVGGCCSSWPRHVSRALQIGSSDGSCDPTSAALLAIVIGNQGRILAVPWTHMPHREIECSIQGWR